MIVLIGMPGCGKSTIGRLLSRRLGQDFGDSDQVIEQRLGCAIRSYFEANHHSVDIIKLNGSVELAPIVGLSDVIVDIVETGNTLKANGLEVLKYFMDFSARMICNPVSFKMKYNEIQQLMDVIREHSMKA